jgi:hypothetical protein
MRLAPAFAAASNFSLIINSASRRAPLPPRINFIILNPTTWFASIASIAKELNIRCPRNRRIANSTNNNPAQQTTCAAALRSGGTIRHQVAKPSADNMVTDFAL